MPKCAVVMTHQFVTMFVTQGWSEWLKCIKGIPEDAVLVEWFISSGIVGTRKLVDLPHLCLIFQYLEGVELDKHLLVRTPSGENVPVAIVQHGKRDDIPKEMSHTFTIDKPGKLRIKSLGDISVSTDNAEGMGHYGSSRLLSNVPLPYEMEELT